MTFLSVSQFYVYLLRVNVYYVYYVYYVYVY